MIFLYDSKSLKRTKFIIKNILGGVEEYKMIFNRGRTTARLHGKVQTMDITSIFPFYIFLFIFLQITPFIMREAQTCKEHVLRV
jgi:hypothetical protein